MSKSAENDASRINLTDDASTIAGKIKRCKTDALDGIAWAEDRPEASNLLTIYQLATGRSRAEVSWQEGGGGSACVGSPVQPCCGGGWTLEMQRKWLRL